MPGFADLEISLNRFNEQDFKIALRFKPLGSDADIQTAGDQPGGTLQDIERVHTLDPHHEDYGKALYRLLFSDADVAMGFEKARTAAQAAGCGLRIRLELDPGIPKIQQLYWECLRDSDGAVLFNGEEYLISRYLSARDWSPVKLEPQTGLRALIAVANPRNLTEFSSNGGPVSPIDAAGVVSRVQAALGGIKSEVVEPASIDQIQARLREGFDILYLVCHGALIQGEAKLYLEDAAGMVDVVDGTQIVDRFRELTRKPRLVLLGSCQSAGSRSGDVAAIGPKLASAGVPAVVAMQSDLLMKTEQTFFPTFFQELARDGQIDRAMGVARGAIRTHYDFWVPVLYMRIISGRLWEAAGPGSPPSAGSLAALQPQAAPASASGPGKPVSWWARRTNQMLLAVVAILVIAAIVYSKVAIDRAAAEAAAARAALDKEVAGEAAANNAAAEKAATDKAVADKATTDRAAGAQVAVSKAAVADKAAASKAATQPPSKVPPPVALSPQGAPARLRQDFSQDKSLGAWLQDSQLLVDVSKAQKDRFMLPKLGFEDRGLNMAGITGINQFTGIQSKQAFRAPASVKATAMGIIANGSVFAITLASADLHEFLEMAGNLNPGQGRYYGMTVRWIAPKQDIARGNGILFYNNNVSVNHWYTMEATVDADGHASVTLSDAGDAVATRANFWVGKDPFFVVLGQREGAPPTVGPNQAIWASVDAEGQAPAPDIPSLVK